MGLANAGMNLESGSYMRYSPRSNRMSAAVEVITLLIENMR